jgi:cell volume regulation protein A
MYHLETWLLSISVLITFSILIAKLSNNTGLPILILFLAVGMLAGSEGPGGIHFNSHEIAQSIGIISLIFILFSGGLETKWAEVRPIMWPAISLSTIGVFLTTLAVGVFVHFVFGISFKVSLLLGAVVSSTDAAAVFSILNTRKLRLRGSARPMLEFESGTNDPMAVFLTVAMIEIITGQSHGFWSLCFDFVMEMGVGLLAGVFMGRLLVFLLNRSNFPIDGFYTVFALAFSVFIYALTVSLHGSGFLSVYVAGLIVNHYEVVHKKAIVRFFDGIAWLSQIGMFLALGLLVFPSELLDNIWGAILIALFLILVARPIGVFASLLFFKIRLKEISFISLVGLRGAVPIILATFPMIAGIPEANWIFNVVFFIVISSALLQGWPLPLLAKWLHMDKPYKKKITSPIEFSDYENSNMQMFNLSISDHNPYIVKKPIVEIPILRGSLVVTVCRDGKYFVPSGGTILEVGDELQILAEGRNAEKLTAFFEDTD